MKRILLLPGVVAFVMMACGATEPKSNAAGVYVPAAPDYADANMWHVTTGRGDSGVDVFYVPSTWEFDWTTADGTVSHWADPSNPQHRADVENEMAGISNAASSPGKNPNDEIRVRAHSAPKSMNFRFHRKRGCAAYYFDTTSILLKNSIF